MHHERGGVVLTLFVRCRCVILLSESRLRAYIRRWRSVARHPVVLGARWRSVHAVPAVSARLWRSDCCQDATRVTSASTRLFCHLTGPAAAGSRPSFVFIPPQSRYACCHMAFRLLLSFGSYRSLCCSCSPICHVLPTYVHPTTQVAPRSGQSGSVCSIWVWLSGSELRGAMFPACLLYHHGCHALPTCCSSCLPVQQSL